MADFSISLPTESQIQSTSAKDAEELKKKQQEEEVKKAEQEKDKVNGEIKAELTGNTNPINTVAGKSGNLQTALTGNAANEKPSLGMANVDNLYPPAEPSVIDKAKNFFKGIWGSEKIAATETANTENLSAADIKSQIADLQKQKAALASEKQQITTQLAEVQNGMVNATPDTAENKMAESVKDTPQDVKTQTSDYLAKNINVDPTNPEALKKLLDGAPNDDVKNCIQAMYNSISQDNTAVKKLDVDTSASTSAN